MLALLVDKALLYKTIQVFLLEFVFSLNKLRCGVMLKHSHIILHINIIVVHHRLNSLDRIRFGIQFIGVLLLVVLGVHITQVNVEYTVALLIQVALRHIVR